VTRASAVTALVVTSLVSAIPGAAWAEQSTPAVDQAARIVARALAEAVTAGNAEAAAALCAKPANLEGEVVTTAEAVRERWAEVLRRDDLRGLRLQNIELLTLEEAIERHGPPPARLGVLEPTTLVAIIRWDRSMLVALLARRDDRWTVIAVTD